MLTRTGKYGNKKCLWKGMVFDSVLERDRFIILEAEQKEGRIKELRRQVRFLLIPDQRINGKLVERECTYIADFAYETPDGRLIVEDTKSKATKTPGYIIKRKLMLQVHQIIIHEIGKENVHEFVDDHRKPDKRS